MKKQLLTLALIFLAYTGINAQILTDNIDSYTLGAIGPQADHWTTWSGDEGGAEDGIVTDVHANSAANSMFVGSTGAQDVVLLLGDQETGAYELSWQVYIPADSAGYYNFQGEATIGTDFVLEVYLNANGTNPGVIAFGGATSADTANYPEDEWFEIKHQIDLDSDIINIFINGEAVYSGAYTGSSGFLSSIDFYSASGFNAMYVDDVSLDSYESCPVPGALICDNFEAYVEGALGPQSLVWTTWSGAEGTAEDGIVSIDYANSGVNCMLIEEGGAQDVILLTGDHSSGRYSLSWNTYFEDSTSTGYYNFQGSPVIGADFVLELLFNAGGAAPSIASFNGLAETYQFPLEAWFNVEHIVDLDNDVMHILFNGSVVATDIPYTSNLSSIDFYSIDDANRMYVDDVVLVELPAVVACDPTDLIYCENFDEFLSGTAVGPWSAEWTTWSGAEGGSEDGIVSSEQALSGGNSMLIAEGGAQDVIVLLGDYDTGAYDVTFNMYVPAGATGYYNFQGAPTIGEDYVQQVFLNNGGGSAGTFEVEGVGTTTYPEDAWFEVRHVINLDTDEMEVFVDGVSAGMGAYAGTTGNLSSMDFYSIDASNRYYVDDFTIAEGAVTGDACVLGAGDIACDNFDSYAVGSTTGPMTDFWTTWSGTEGGGEDGIVSDDQAFSGTNSMLIAEGSAQDVVLQLGDQTSGSYDISWMHYIPANATGYYNIQETEVPGTAWNLDVFFNQDGGAPGTGLVLTDGTSFTYPEDQWFEVKQTVNLDTDLLNLWIDGTQILTDFAYTGNLGGINFFSIDATNRSYIDDMLYTDTPVGIAELAISNLEIFPNPNTGEFTIVNDEVAGFYTLNVVDLTGRAVFSEAMNFAEGASHTVRLNNVTPGVYLVQLLNEENATLRIVKMIVE